MTTGLPSARRPLSLSGGAGPVIRLSRRVRHHSEAELHGSEHPPCLLGSEAGQEEAAAATLNYTLERRLQLSITRGTTVTRGFPGRADQELPPHTHPH
jgi:hypothetical protein